MDVRDLDLRKAAASLVAERAAQTTHPDVEDLVAYHACELSEARTEEIQAHVAACRACGDLLLELHRMEREESRPWTVFSEWLARATDPLRERWSGRARQLVAGEAGESAFWGRAPALAGAAAVLLLVPAAFLAYYSMRNVERAPLGAYVMELHGDIKAMRGRSDEPANEPFRFAPGMTFDLTLFPMEPVQGDVEVEAFRSSDGRVQGWPVPVEVSDEGAVRIMGRVGQDIILPPGASVVLVAVGRPGAIPAGEELEQRLAATNAVQESDWTAWRLRVSIVRDNNVP